MSLIVDQDREAITSYSCGSADTLLAETRRQKCVIVTGEDIDIFQGAQENVSEDMFER
jgi:hypothetical protein